MDIEDINLKHLTFVSLLLAILFSTSASATTVSYSLVNLGGSSYQYNYTLLNDTLGFDVDQFSIYYDLGLYENLAVTSSPVGWDSIVFQPDAGLPDDGIFDTLALGSPLSAGDSLGGFSVSFDWLGSGSGPGEQYFELFDFNFDLIDSGTTVSQVPAPAAIWLFGSALLGLAGIKRKV